jgi:putative transposase
VKIAIFDDERVTELISTTIGRKPEHATHWSVRTLAAQTGLSPTTVYRYTRLFGLQPHRAKSFKPEGSASRQQRRES